MSSKKALKISIITVVYNREKVISKNYIGNGQNLFGWSTTKTETNVELHTAAEPF